MFNLYYTVVRTVIHIITGALSGIT